MILKGSCLCGGIQYEINQRLKEVRNCHCTSCRKAHSAAFRTRASINSQNFNLIQGEELLTFYESDPGTHRGFCKICGSALFSKFDNKDEFGFSLGTLDTDPAVKAQYHIFVSEKAAWFEITDELPQYEKFPANIKV